VTNRERLHLLVDQPSDGEAAETLAFLEQRPPGGESGSAAQSSDLLTLLQEEVLARVPPEVSLVDELLGERRRDALREAVIR
jgi:hypothetical protein